MERKRIEEEGDGRRGGRRYQGSKRIEDEEE